MNSKVMLLFLLLIVALYITATAIGLSRSDDPKAKPTTSWVDSLKGMMRSSEPNVSPSEITPVPGKPAMFAGGVFTLAARQKSEFKVASSSHAVRKLTLHLLGPGKATVRWKTNGDPEIKMEVPMETAGDTAKLTVTGAGGLLSLEGGTILSKLKLDF
jgi:hypothetical protein